MSIISQPNIKQSEPTPVHTLTYSNKIELTGVLAIELLQPTKAVIKTDKGILTIEGYKLEAESVDIASGKAVLQGSINCLKYSSSTKSQAIKKLFK